MYIKVPVICKLTIEINGGVAYLNANRGCYYL